MVDTSQNIECIFEIPERHSSSLQDEIEEEGGKVSKKETKETDQMSDQFEPITIIIAVIAIGVLIVRIIKLIKQRKSGGVTVLDLTGEKPTVQKIKDEGIPAGTLIVKDSQGTQTYFGKDNTDEDFKSIITTALSMLGTGTA